jgi:hypothetical protein
MVNVLSIHEDGTLKTVEVILIRVEGNEGENSGDEYNQDTLYPSMEM